MKDINKNHRKLYKSCIENNINYIKCVWVADILYNSTAELRMIEEQYRKDLNGNLNSRRCYITDTERKQPLEYMTKWNKKNSENKKDDMIKVSKLLEKMC